MYLFLWRRAKLFGFLCGDGGRHVEREHQLIIAKLLVELQLGNETVGERHDRLDPVPQLTVTEIMKQITHLKKTQRETFTPQVIHTLLYLHYLQTFPRQKIIHGN